MYPLSSFRTLTKQVKSIAINKPSQPSDINYQEIDTTTGEVELNDAGGRDSCMKNIFVCWYIVGSRDSIKAVQET